MIENKKTKNKITIVQKEKKGFFFQQIQTVPLTEQVCGFFVLHKNQTETTNHSYQQV
jgi:hypothetical protein